MSFKDKIRELRVARNLTQLDVAKGTGLSPSAIGMCMNKADGIPVMKY